MGEVSCCLGEVVAGSHRDRQELDEGAGAEAGGDESFAQGVGPGSAVAVLVVDKVEAGVDEAVVVGRGGRVERLAQPSAGLTAEVVVVGELLEAGGRGAGQQAQSFGSVDAPGPDDLVVDEFGVGVLFPGEGFNEAKLSGESAQSVARPRVRFDHVHHPRDVTVRCAGVAEAPPGARPKGA